MSSLDQESMVWIFCVTATAICAIILTIVLCTHVYHAVTATYLEKIDTINRIAGVLTFISSGCFTGVVILQLILWFVAFIQHCYPLQLLLALLWGPAKLFMHLVFVMNLHFVYKRTLYRYNTLCLSSIAVSLIIVYNLLLLWTCITLFVTPVRISNGTGMRCNADSDSVSAIIILIVDTVCSIGFVVAFTHPIRRMVRHHGQTSSTDRVMYAETKVVVLVTTASISTLIMLLGFRVLIPIGSSTLTAMVYVMVPTDSVINVISLILLAQYYDKKQCFSFETVCCCMIACCRCVFGINQIRNAEHVHTTKSKSEIPTSSSNHVHTHKNTSKTHTRTPATDRHSETMRTSGLSVTALDEETTTLISVPAFRKDVSSFDPHPSQTI